MLAELEQKVLQLQRTTEELKTTVAAKEKTTTTAARPAERRRSGLSAAFFVDAIMRKPTPKRKAEKMPSRRSLGARLLSTAPRSEPAIVPGRKIEENLKSTSLFRAKTMVATRAVTRFRKSETGMAAATP